MFINPTIELTVMLDNNKFKKLFSRICSKSSCIEENDEGYIDNSLADKGMVVLFRNSQYKKKVRLIVKPCIMLDEKKPDSEKFLRKLNKRIDEYFGGQYQLADFKMSKAVLSTDIDVHIRENVSAYLKIFQRIGKVKGFSQIHYDCFEKGESFCLDGNSNGTEFLIYDLGRALYGQLGKKSILDKTAGILRVEVQLMKPSAVLNYTDTSDVSEQILNVLNNRRDLFFEVFAHVVPFGDFCKKDRAIEIVRKNVENNVLRRKMIRLIALVPEKKSLWLAQKAINCRDMDKIMEEFAKINLAPVTISKRCDVKHIKSLYTYMI